MKNDIFHYFNRGCNRENIFFNKGNYIFLIKKMKQTYRQYGLSIIAYCLMPNHYHFLIKQKADQPVSDWIKALFIGYVQAVNIEQNRSGTLFEGRAKNILIDKEEYLLQLVRYIHCNPLSAGIVPKLADWPYSNYHEWIGQRKGTLFDSEFFHTYFRNYNDYQEFISDYSEEKLKTKKMRKYLFD